MSTVDRPMRPMHPSMRQYRTYSASLSWKALHPAVTTCTADSTAYMSQAKPMLIQQAETGFGTAYPIGSAVSAAVAAAIAVEESSAEFGETAVLPSPTTPPSSVSARAPEASSNASCGVRDKM